MQQQKTLSGKFIIHLSYYGDVPQASQARVASMYEEELELQHPLYAVHGYDEKQVRCA